MSPPLGIVRLAREFWQQTGRVLQPQFDIENACSRALPLSIESLPDVTHHSIVHWLRDVNVEVPMPRVNRKLHGGIVACGGRGYIFVNEMDSPKERAFTIAHEIGHFLAVPRNRVLERLGPGVLEVLDGLRQPTLDERAYAVLSGVSLPLYRHGSERNGFWGCRSLKGSSEAQADQIAVELLAPESEVARYVRIDGMRKFGEIEADINDVLENTFGLPQSIASLHAKRLALSWTGGPSVREWLGLI